MKLLRIMLATFLVVGMLLGVSSIAYADDPPDVDPPPADNPGDDPNPSLQVDILVEGENPEVNIGVGGDNPNVNLGIDGDSPNVYLSGRNINEPTVIRYDYGGGGVDGSWVKKKIGQAVNPLYSWMDEYEAKVELAANGLAKVIMLAQGNESTLEAQVSLSNEYGNRLTELESDSAYLGKRVKTLEAQDEAIKAYVQDYASSLRAYYNRILVTIVIIFSVIVLGLAAGLGVLWRKTRIG